MKIVKYKGDLEQFLHRYNYLQTITDYLNKIVDIPWNQSIINEIVLWKVNRYVPISEEVLQQLNKLTSLKRGQHVKGRNVLNILLQISGVDLPMASTILRFRNPNVFQIIDRHAYRAVYGKNYPFRNTNKSTKTIQNKISLYFTYLDKLIELCEQKKLDFITIDRLLYQFDKDENGKL